jgi:hypothetical protein
MALFAHRTPQPEGRNRKAIVDRRWRLTALLLGAVVLNLGCNPMTLTYFMLFGKEERIEPQCVIASKEKEVKLVIQVAFANLEARPEFVACDRELAERLTQALAKRYEENKDKVKIVPVSQVKLFENKHPDWREWTPREIGKQFNADYLLIVEINSMGLYERGSFNRLYRGQTEIALAVTDVNKPAGEEKKWDHLYTTTYPETRPIEVEGSSVGQFRTLFLNHIAKDVSKLLASYTGEERNVVEQ